MNAVEMNSSNVIKELYSQWDDSSLDDEPTASNSVNKQTSIPNEDLENLIREESIHLVVPCHENTILNIGESSQPDEEKSIDPSLDHLISEETVSDFDILEKPSSPITEPSPIKKKRGRKPKSKDTKPKTSKPKVTARKRNAKKFDDLDEPKKNTTRKQTKKSQPLKHGKDDDDATDTEKCNEDDDPKIGQLPSVYSRNQIAKHRKRINQLKQLEQDTDSESDVDTDAALDRDLDINLRIFEESAKSVDTVVGEIQCNFIDDQSCAEATNTNKIPVNVFQFTVNSNCVEVCDNADDSENRISKKTSGSDNIEDISLFDDPMEYSDNDSDLEILVSKPIIRKRAAPHVKKEKHTEKKQKLTMYDLIHDNGPFSPESKDEGSDIDQKDDIKLNEAKKIKTSNKNLKPLKKEEPAENAAECTQTTEQKDQNLPVPKLKIGADGEVVIDMDSLVIEQTGVSEARSALANSEVIEECSLSYNTYNKKNNFRKQWTPHETLKFYQVLSTIGTDFTLMATLFPGRTRKCMKRKFKREEKTNADLILKALSCKQNFNIDLLEKELQLKDEKLNQLKENNKKRKPAQKKEVNKKETKAKRKSFFQSSIQSFQNGET